MGIETVWSSSVRLTAELASASEAREFVQLHLLGHGLSHLAEDVRLVVSELATNAIQHTQLPFTVLLQREGPSVTLTVRDFSPLVPVLTTADRWDPGGRGLVIVDVVSDDWGVTHNRDGSKSVWAAFPAEASAVATC